MDAHAIQVLVYASINTDMSMVTERLPQAGETLTAESYTDGTGGKGANQAVAISRMSQSSSDGIRFKSSMTDMLATLKSLDELNTCLTNFYNDDNDDLVVVNMVGAVGNDSFGLARAKDIAVEGVAVSRIHQVEGASTGIANIIVDQKSGENRILLHAGANSLIETQKTLQGISEGLFSVLVVNLEIPLAKAVRIMTLASKHRVKIVFNPSPAVKHIPREALEAVSFLIVNETEAAILSDQDRSFVEDESNLSATADLLLDKGVETVIITLGGRGSYFKTRKESQSGVKEDRIESNKIDKVVDTTGAGDTFLGAFVCRLAQAVSSRENFDIQHALRWANIAGGLSVQRPGAMASIPYRDEVDKAFAPSK